MLKLSGRKAKIQEINNLWHSADSQVKSYLRREENMNGRIVNHNVSIRELLIWSENHSNLARTMLNTLMTLINKHTLLLLEVLPEDEAYLLEKG